MRLCACGCGNEIKLTWRHKYRGIPKYKLGHHHKGKKLTEETKRKISERAKGRICSEETRQKISIANKGHKMSEEIREKLAEINKGNKYTLGYRHTEESKRKISESKVGKRKQFTEEWKRNISKALMGNTYGKGYKHTKETKQKMSQGRLREKNGRWLGGIGYEPYTTAFNLKLKEKIRERDNHLCQLCGKTEPENGRKLDVHHADYVKENCEEKNLIALCNTCNTKVNANRIFWTGFFVGYIISRNKFV